MISFEILFPLGKKLIIIWFFFFMIKFWNVMFSLTVRYILINWQILFILSLFDLTNKINDFYLSYFSNLSYSQILPIKFKHFLPSNIFVLYFFVFCAFRFLYSAFIRFWYLLMTDLMSRWMFLFFCWPAFLWFLFTQFFVFMVQDQWLAFVFL